MKTFIGKHLKAHSEEQERVRKSIEQKQEKGISEVAKLIGEMREDFGG